MDSEGGQAKMRTPEVHYPGYNPRPERNGRRRRLYPHEISGVGRNEYGSRPCRAARHDTVIAAWLEKVLSMMSYQLKLNIPLFSTRA